MIIIFVPSSSIWFTKYPAYRLHDYQVLFLISYLGVVCLLHEVVQVLRCLALRWRRVSRADGCCAGCLRRWARSSRYGCLTCGQGGVGCSTKDSRPPGFFLLLLQPFTRLLTHSQPVTSHSFTWLVTHRHSTSGDEGRPTSCSCSVMKSSSCVSAASASFSASFCSLWACSTCSIRILRSCMKIHEKARLTVIITIIVIVTVIDTISSMHEINHYLSFTLSDTNPT